MCAESATQPNYCLASAGVGVESTNEGYIPLIMTILRSCTSSAIADAFSVAGCTTLEAAKALTDDTPCLRRFPAEQRNAFLQQIAAGDITCEL
jgi:hypothetical protein